MKKTALSRAEQGHFAAVLNATNVLMHACINLITKENLKVSPSLTISSQQYMINAPYGTLLSSVTETFPLVT